MNLTIQPAARVQGNIVVPGNKSISHRAAIFGALTAGTTRIENFLRADDTLATLQCLRSLGVTIEERADGDLLVYGVGFDGLKAPAQPLDCGNSGTTIRLLLGVLAGRPWPSELIGDESLSKRPMDRVRVPLEQMGARITGNGERCTPPLVVQGVASSNGASSNSVPGSLTLNSITYEMPVASGQVKSAILLAGLQAKDETIVIEPTRTRDHSERMLRAFGVPVQEVFSGDGARVSVQGGACLVATDVQVPGDISSAAYFLAAAALRPGWEITVRDIGTNPTRDGMLDVLRDMGAEVALQNQRESGGEPIANVTVRGGDLRAVEIGGALIPRLIDELPVLALLATQAEGETVIRDAGEMRVKESDRIAVISRELRKLGARIEEKPDGMIVSGPTPLLGAAVTSPPGDHRIAMTLAVAGLIAQGHTTVENAQAITSSFPNFADLLQAVVMKTQIADND